MQKRKRKMAIIMFADIVGFTSMSEQMDAEEVINILNIVWDDIDTIILDNSGMIDKHNGDNVIATWGINNTYRDNPILAAKVALDIVNFFNRVKTTPEVHFRVGLHYGPLVSGEIGKTPEFTIIGDAVNTAARLESTAKNGTVQISRNFAELVKHQYQIEEIGFVSLKGKDEPLKTFRLVKELEHKQDITFVYFDNRVQELSDSIDKNLEHTKYHVIVGSQGTGKSELLKEYVNNQKVDPTNLVVSIEAQRNGRGKSWFILEQVLQKITNELGFTETDLELLSMMNSRDVIIRTLLHYELQENEKVSFEFDNIFDAIITFLKKILSQHPYWDRIVFAIDEYTFIDESSKLFFKKLHEGYLKEEIVVVTTSNETIEDSNYIEQKLGPIDNKSASILLGDINDEKDTDYTKRLVKQSSGNLLFILEMNRYIRKSGSNELPDSLSNLVQIQLESLSNNTYDLIKCASVCGVLFTKEFLTDHLGSEYTDNYKEAYEKSLIYLESKDMWSFSSKTVHNLVYDSILLEERIEIHKSYANWIEQNGVTNDSIHDVAYHFYKGNELKKAFDYYKLIISRYVQLGLYLDAVKVIETVAKFIDLLSLSIDEKAQYTYNQSFVYFKTMENKKAMELIQSTYNFVNYETNRDMYIRFVILQAEIGLDYSQETEIIDACKLIDDICLKEENSELIARKFLYESYLDYLHSDLDGYYDKLKRGVALATKNDDLILISKFQTYLAAYHTLSGNYDKAKQYSLQTISTLEKTNSNITFIAKSLSELAGIYGDTGEYIKSEEYIVRAYELLENSQRNQVYLLTMVNLIESKLRLRKLDDFIYYLKILLPQSTNYTKNIASVILCIVVRYFFTVGRLEEANKYIGYTYNCNDNYIPIIDYVNNMTFNEFPDYKPNNLDIIKTQSKVDDLAKITNEIMLHFDQLFSSNDIQGGKYESN